jgi:hypothetical protein
VDNHGYRLVEDHRGTRQKRKVCCRAHIRMSKMASTTNGFKVYIKTTPEVCVEDLEEQGAKGARKILSYGNKDWYVAMVDSEEVLEKLSKIAMAVEKEQVTTLRELTPFYMGKPPTLIKQREEAQ